MKLGVMCIPLRQLRPELVMRYKIPLSSDAQSKFSSLSSSRSPSPNTVSIDDAKVDAPSADHVRAIKEIRGATAQMVGIRMVMESVSTCFELIYFLPLSAISLSLETLSGWPLA